MPFTLTDLSCGASGRSSGAELSGTPGPQPARRCEQVHPDTVVVDRLTAFLNRDPEPSGADALELMSLLIHGSGRPLLAETWPVEATVSEDRYGIPTATVTAGHYQVRVVQATDDAGDLRVEITDDDGDDVGLAVTVNGRRVLGPMPCT